MRDKIIDATVEEFKQNGLKFTMNDLAKRLGISKKTIYTVFESKQAVLVAVADRYAADLNSMQEEGLIREVSIPVVMAMVKGTVYCFMESDILYQNELTYEQAKKEMVEILMKGIKTGGKSKDSGN